MSYEDQTRNELRDELKRRDLPVSGTKDELVERLEEADQEDGRQDDGDDGGTSGGDDGGTSGGDDGGTSGGDGDSTPDREGSDGLKPMQLARLAAAQLMQLTGRDIDGTSGIERTDEGWRVLFEVVEVSRVPRGMDVLGLYEVIVDGDGDLLRYERLRRYGRTQTTEDSE